MKNNIKRIREEKNMTQQDCADNLGITLRAWQTYEQGVSEPKQKLLFKIADMFEVSIDYLLGREELTSIDKIGGEFNMTALEKIILEEYIKLPAETRGDLMQFLRDSVQRVMDSEKPKIETRKVITAARSPTSQGATVEEYPVSTLEALKNAPDRSGEIDDL